MKALPLLLALLLILAACTPSEDTPVGSPPTEQIPNPDPVPDPNPNPQAYLPLGVGGGGAMSGVAISPYSNIWFVGTDMGTLFRSVDEGESWIPVNHLEAVFNSDLSKAVSPGFSSDGTTVFHASKGINPKRSLDGGLTFSSINIPLTSGEYIKYWHSDSLQEDLIFCATSKGLLRSENKGVSWTRATGINEEAVGSFIDYSSKTFYQATKSGIWASNNEGKSFTKVHTPSGIQIRQFTGGRDNSGLTLAYADNNGTSACSWVMAYKTEWGQAAVNDTVNSCGFVWVSNSNNNFIKNNQAVGDHIKMAENDAQTIYVTGGRKWIRQYGTKIYVSKDKGQSWNLKLHQMNWDITPFLAWPSSKLEYSAVALDVGWWDDGYESFDVNRRNSAVAAGSGYFFMHSTKNSGENWLAPFTKYADTGAPASKKKWDTRGIEVISVYRMKNHPKNPNILYAASADIGGMVSENAGKSFRVSKAQYNSNYDYSFDENNQNIVYAASGNSHDWPNDWHANAITSEGGIYKSSNKGLTWTRLTPTSSQFNRQYLSVAYDSLNGIIYGGSQENGIARSTDNGASWSLFNTGLPSGNNIIPQIEVDPHTGNAYALVTGNAPDFTNQTKTGIYFLDVANRSETWKLLRGTVHYPPDADAGYKVWFYPTAFAIDFNAASGTDNLWLVDYENHGNWLMTGVWKSSDRGLNWNRVKQLTHATDIKIDPSDPSRVYASGYFTLDGSWGNGGQFYTIDNGATWKKDAGPPLQQNARSVLINPTDTSRLIYSYFGGGMLSGRNPANE